MASMPRWFRAFLSWPYAFAFCLSMAVGATAIYFSHDLNVGLKDPEGFLGPAYIRLPMLGLLLFAAGLAPQAIHRYGIKRVFSGMRTIVRDEWTLKRVGYATTGMVSFYICYVSYRNLKSYLPELTDTIHDRALLQLDHVLFFGNNPAEVLHSALGTTVAAQVLAVLYVLYLPVVPITVAAVLVLHRDVTVGAWYATAVSLNWVLGVVSYYSLPTLGPAFSPTCPRTEPHSCRCRCCAAPSASARTRKETRSSASPASRRCTCRSCSRSRCSCTTPASRAPSGTRRGSTWASRSPRRCTSAGTTSPTTSAVC
jgi:hypothetical protein